MQLSSRQEFPAPPADVYAMVTDEAFLRHAPAQMGSPHPREGGAPHHTPGAA